MGKVSELTWVAFDTETTGQYPIQSEICEIAAVKWCGGREVSSFQSFIKPTVPMGEAVIKIHGITNEMIQDAPPAKDVLKEFSEFIRGGTLLAHHAQFDLGFLASEMETAGLDLWQESTICTSLLSQKVVTETSNHKLQTLASYFSIDPGQAHRALDDARTCLSLALKIFERLPESMTVEALAGMMLRRSQNDLGPMQLKRFSIKKVVRDFPAVSNFINAIRDHKFVEMVYAGGSRPGQRRTLEPLGVICQLDGDAVVAREPGSTQNKRYWIKDVISVKACEMNKEI